ncbi:integrase core domain-containing protein [Paenibacillus larvae]|nr:DDE-type integrase/transposase/recombinase [Paenibacillus larvae]MDT2302822.1 integrase core domain-containing protein [Paenibacillus larvae]
MADITYIPTDEGWLYLASLEDLCTRKIVGFHMGERMTRVCPRALDQAYRHQRPKGTVYCIIRIAVARYASSDYQTQLRQYGMTGNMSRKGNCYDNACIESFHNVLKKEPASFAQIQNQERSQGEDFEYITCFYNGKRIHSSIGYLTPNQCEHMICLAA